MKILLTPDQLNELFPATPILIGYRGSIAHGMFVPSSDPNSIDDRDLMAVSIPPIDYYFAFNSARFGSRGTYEKWLGEYDAVTYELKKYISLLVNSNPNVLSLLWNHEHHYILRTAAGQMLIDNRQLFVTKKIYHAFTGYAAGQLKRMTHLAFEGYMGEKRKALVQKHGYDTKNAAHAIRLLRMGIEYLQSGILNVDRSNIDAQELLDIKKGLWPLEQVKADGERLFAIAKQALQESTLPEEPDAEQVNALTLNIFRAHSLTNFLGKMMSQ